MEEGEKPMFSRQSFTKKGDISEIFPAFFDSKNGKGKGFKGANYLFLSEKA